MQKRYLLVLLISFQINQILCQNQFGSIFPIPSTIENDDPKFTRCPDESGAYTHSTNCSLFHMCTFGVHAIYSCIDEFYFNPYSGKCQYFSMKTQMKCENIIGEMTKDHVLPLPKLGSIDHNQRRKSASSKCTQAGIYPDILDCSIFHYCRSNGEHELYHCPNELHFDPKIFMCSAPQLVNCQYEPPVESEITDSDETTENKDSDPICRDYASGTYLPVANKYDEYVICKTSGQSIKMKCKSGLTYNALTKTCEMKSCQTKSTLCQNQGQCVDDSTNSKGFRCVCSLEYRGEFCETYIQLAEKTIAKNKNKISTSTENLLNFADRLHQNDKKPTIENEPNILPKVGGSMNPVEKNSPLSRLVHRLNYQNYNENQIDELVKSIFIILLIFISLILLASSIFGMIICLRLYTNTPAVETVGTWKVLPEESKV